MFQRSKGTDVDEIVKSRNLRFIGKAFEVSCRFR